MITCYHLISPFLTIIIGMSEIPLNKFEKRDLILRLLKEGKTYREICLLLISPRDTKPIAKKYERKKKLQPTKVEKKKKNKKKPIYKFTGIYSFSKKGNKLMKLKFY